MESKIQQYIAHLSPNSIQEGCLRGFQLYEEFSGQNIFETLKERKALDRFDLDAQKRVEKEVENFFNWIKQNKGLPPTVAYYYAISLKSILTGLPIGVEIGLLFGVVLEHMLNT